MLDVTKTGTYHQMQAELRCHEAARSLPMTSSPDDLIAEAEKRAERTGSGKGARRGLSEAGALIYG